MLETDKLFAGSIPENYDRYMVPLISAVSSARCSFPTVPPLTAKQDVA